MAQSKMFRVVMMVPAALLHDLMSMQDMRGVRIEDINAVKHGGFDEETGAMQAKPTSREFILAYAATHHEFAVYDLGEAAHEAGLNRNGVKQAAVTLTNDGLLRRVDQGRYAITKQALANVERTIDAAKGIAPPKKKSAKKSEKHAMPLKEGSVSTKIIAFVKEHQGGGAVALKDIKKGLGMNGKNISPQIFDLMSSQRLTRTGPSLYRVEG